MKTYIEKTETVTSKVYDKTLCDICGRESTRYEEWDDDPFQTNQIEICHKRGFQYPEGGELEELDLDICPDCFTGKILPFIRGLGVMAEYREYSV